MAEPTTDELKNKFTIASQVKGTQLDFCLAGAIRDVKRIIGIDAYDEIFLNVTPASPTIIDNTILDQDATTINEAALRAEDVSDAVYYYAAANLVLNTSLRIRATGQVKRETANESPGIGSGSRVDIEYLSPTEVAQVSGQLRSEGDRLLSPYFVSRAEQSSSFSVALTRS